MDLEQLLSERGLDAERVLGSSLPGLEEKLAPGTFERARALTRSLAEANIEPAYVLEYGVPLLVAHADEHGGDIDAWLLALEVYVRALPSECDIWSAIEFCLPGPLRLAGADLAAARELMAGVAGLIVAIYEQKISTTRTLQYGIRTLGDAARARVWAFTPAMAFATRLAHAGADPGFLLQITVPAWLDAAHDDPERFTRALGTLESFVGRVHEAGMHTGLPLSTGLEALARYPSGEEHLVAWLGRLLVLIRATVSRELSPYAAMEYGVPNVARPGAVTEDQLSALFDFAVVLADRGIEPGAVLAEAVPAYDEISTGIVLDLGNRLAHQGIDPFFVLRNTLPALMRMCEVRGLAIDEPLEAVARIASALHAGDVSARKTFEDGFTVLVQECGDQYPRVIDETIELAIELAERGVAPGMTMAFGVPDVVAVAKGRDWVVRGALDTSRVLAGHAVDPATVLCRGVPVLLDVCGDDSAAFNRLRVTLQELVVTLEESGVGHRDVLFYDIPSLAEVQSDARAEAFEGLLVNLRQLLGKLSAAGIAPTEVLHHGVPAAARAGRERPWVLVAAMEIAGELADRGVDPGPCLQHGVGPLAEQAGDDEATLRALLEIVAEFVQKPGTETVLEHGVDAASQVAGRRVGVLSDLLDGVALCLGAEGLSPEQRGKVAATFPRLARVVGDDGAALLRLSGEMVAHSQRLLEAGQPIEGFLWRATEAVANVAGTDVEACARLLTELTEVLAGRADDDATRCLVELGASTASAVSGAGSFTSTVAHIATFVDALADAELDVRDAADHALSLARVVAHEDTRGFAEVLAFLRRFLTGAVMRESALPILYNLSRLQPLLSVWPTAWPDLVVPALESHKQHADMILRGLEYIARHIQRASDFDILREVITQYGVRAPEILTGLIAEGLHSRAIDDLTSHKETLSRFIRELPFYDPEVYTAFREIHTERGLSERERRDRSKALRAELEELAAAVRSGEVTEAQERSKLFGLVLYYVFPPAISSSRHTYERLYRSTPDRPEDLVAHDAGELQRRAYPLQKGAYELRPGVSLERAPWELVLQVATDDAAPVTTPEELGWEMLSRWAEGRIARERYKVEILAKVLARFRAGGMQLPQAAETPPQLLAFKEFLGDHVRDVVEECLLACQHADQERYRRVVRDKLAPRLELGKGLLRGIWTAVEQLKQGRISRAQAARRLRAQLNKFVFDEDSLIDLLLPVASMDGAKEALAQLERREVELEPGKEVQRLLGDLVGAELHVMNQELFGGPGHPAKLVYRISANSPHLELRFEVTKRKAHVVIGYAEGVCVAPDRQLWDNPDFLQVVFWDPMGIAAGGMHVLLVEERGERYLSLPGINPSMKLLEQVEPGAMLDAALDYAWRLARRWQLAGVWIPASPGIYSNRRAIHMEMAKRQYATRRVEQNRFSYSPYAYTFAQVLEVPEHYLPEPA